MRVIWNIWLGYFVIPFLSYLYINPEVDQFGSALLLAPQYSLIPFIILFSIIICFIKQNLKDNKFFTVLLISLCFATTSGPTAFLINMYIGHQKEIILTGTVVEKMYGLGKGRPYIKIKDNLANRIVILRIPRSCWNNAVVGEDFSINVREGLLGFYYRK